MAFEGELKDLSLGDIFQTITQNRQTGTLELTLATDKSVRPRIFFLEGKIALFSPDETTGPPFAEVLRKAGAIPDGFVGGKKDGKLQIRSAKGEWKRLEPKDHKNAAEKYLADAIGDLFRYTGGHFRF